MPRTPRSFATTVALSAAALTVLTVPPATAAVATAAPGASAGTVAVELAPALRQAPKGKKGKGKKATRTTVTWPAASMAVGTPATAVGQVKDSYRGKRKVLLQQHLKTGWYTVDKAKADKQGNFALAVPTYWAYDADLRVDVPRAGRSPADTSRKQRISTSLTYTPAGNPQDWQSLGELNNNKTKFRVNPCQVVTYKLNLTGSLPNSANDVTYAINQISQATGLRYRYTGTTDTIVGGKGSWPGKTDLVISWNTPEQTNLPLGDNTIGYGVVLRSVYARSSEKTRNLALPTRMGVTIDNTHLLANNAEQTSLLMHELGHTVGLGHSAPNGGQIMDGTGASYDLPLQWGAGDITGLHSVGMLNGCMTVRR